VQNAQEILTSRKIHRIPLARFFDDPPLVGNETKEEYKRLYDAIAADEKPATVF
jgi:hypothetical protein